jgi:hypothetical protein
MEDKPTGDAKQTEGTQGITQPPSPTLAQAKAAEVQGADPKAGKDESATQTPPKTRWERLKGWVWPMAFSDAVMIGLTFFIALGTVVSAVAIGFQWWELHIGGKDTTRIADAAQKQACAANRSADAAQQFADTAALISGGIGDAVKKLEAQAKNSAAAIKATQDAMRQDQRAWVVLRGVGGRPELDKPWTIQVVFTNTGKTPAKRVLTSCNIEPAISEDNLIFKEFPPRSSGDAGPE